MDTKMKIIIKPFVPVLLPICIMLLGMMVACSSDDDSGGSLSTGISLHIQAVTRASDGSVNTGSKAENIINSVGVWFFAKNAMNGEQALYYTQQSVSADNGELLLNFSDEELRLHHDMNSEGSYQLFVAANLPADATIGATTTLNDLKNYSYSATARPGSPFCMTGSTNVAHNFAIDSRVSIPLVRVASRLDIKIVNETGKTLQVNKVSIANDQRSVQLFAPVSGAAAPAPNSFSTATDIYTAAVTADEVTCSGYIYENRSAGAIKLVIDGSINGVPVIWKADIKPDGVATLLRNTVCEATLKLKDKLDPTDVECIITDWYSKDMNGVIHGTYLDVNSNIVDVIYGIGGSVTVRTDAENIEVDLSSATKYYLSGHEGESKVTVSVKDKECHLAFIVRGQSDEIIPDENIIITVGNLSKTITLSKKETALLFVLKSILIDGAVVKNGDHITIPSWNSGSNANMIIEIDCNMTWAYKLSYTANDGLVGSVPLRGIVQYTGASNTFKKSVNLRYDDIMVPDLLPVKAQLDLYLMNYDEKFGVKMQTFNFTIVKP